MCKNPALNILAIFIFSQVTLAGPYEEYFKELVDGQIVVSRMLQTGEIRSASNRIIAILQTDRPDPPPGFNEQGLRVARPYSRKNNPEAILRQLEIVLSLIPNLIEQQRRIEELRERRHPLNARAKPPITPSKHVGEFRNRVRGKQLVELAGIEPAAS